MSAMTIKCKSLSATSAAGDTEFTGEGQVTLTEHGRLHIRIETPLDPILRFPHGPYDIHGTSDQKDEIVASQAYIDKNCWDSNGTGHVEFVPCDCLIRAPNSQGSAWNRRVLRVKNVSVLWEQTWTDSVAVYKLRRARDSASRADSPDRDRLGLIDHELTMKCSSPTTGPSDEERVRTLRLLSLAQRCPCVAPAEEFYLDDRLLETRFRPFHEDSEATHPLVPRDCIGDFMSQASPNYQKYEANLDLNALIQYYCRSHTESHAEMKFLFAGVVMESLKFHWALNIRKLPTKKAASGIVVDFLKSTGGRYSFEELLQMVAADLGLLHTYTFIANRNTIFHTGKAAAAQVGNLDIWPFLKPELVQLHDQIDDLLLAICGYSGPITTYWEADKRLKFPERLPIR